jgi:uncharacterized protein YndB with AHSA1/START domain
MSIRQHDFTIERRFRQRPEQTFQAFADPDLRQRWFRVPDSWTNARSSASTARACCSTGFTPSSPAR